MDRKPVFDAVRKVLGRGFTDDEVAALDRALDQTLSSQPAQAIGEAGRALIRKWEGCGRRRSDGMFAAYPDPGSADGSPWTIGWGATGPGIGPGTRWSATQCDARLEEDLARYSAEVSAAIGAAPTSQNQFDALVSFHYNTGRIASCALTARHIAGDYAGARAEFGRWVRNDGAVLRGLVRRRDDEAALYAQSSTVGGAG
jgi:lysozyme